MISKITFINIFMLASAQRELLRGFGSPAWHLEPQNNAWVNPIVGLPDPGSAGHAIQWQDSQALSQWQEDAAGSLPHSYSNAHSHYAQLLSAPSQPQMNSYGQPGFSPYGTPFHSVRTVGEKPANYTAVMKLLDDASRAMLKHVSLNEDGKLTDTQIQHVMLLTAVIDLIDDLINMETEAYPTRYKTVIQDSIAKVEKNPLLSASSIKARIEAVQKQLIRIMDFIKLKQKTECIEPVSAECDLIIDTALDNSGNPELQAQANFLLALGDSMKLLTRHYLVEIRQVANSHGALNFLLNAQEYIKPLVLAGTEARKVGLQAKLLPLLRSHSDRLHRNRLDNNLHYLRTRNHNNEQ